MWQWCIWLYMIFVLSNVMMKPSNVSKIGVSQNVTMVWSYVMFVLSNVTLTSSNVSKKKKNQQMWYFGKFYNKLTTSGYYTPKNR